MISCWGWTTTAKTWFAAKISLLMMHPLWQGDMQARLVASLTCIMKFRPFLVDKTDVHTRVGASHFFNCPYWGLYPVTSGWWPGATQAPQFARVPFYLSHLIFNSIKIYTFINEKSTAKITPPSLRTTKIQKKKKIKKLRSSTPWL